MADLTINSDDLAALSLEQLADRFEAIEQQGQLFQGQILLEARNRFPSNKEFGQWCAINSICVDSQQHRTRLMNLARFFASRELDKIGISAAYEIAAPVNADIAVAVYEYAKGKNLPLAEVRKQIAMRKGESLPIPVRIIPTDKPLITGRPIEEEVEIITAELEECLMSKEQQILDILKDLSDGEQLKILREVTRTVNDRMRPNR
jgi:hypothetical protein